MTHTKLVEVASEMISKIFSDDSVDKEQIRESLEELKDDIQELLDNMGD